MPTADRRAPARVHGELTSVLARARRHSAYLVWPYGQRAGYIAWTTQATQQFFRVHCERIIAPPSPFL